MYGRFVDWILLSVSFVGLAVTGWWTVYAAPNSAQNLQSHLQEDVNSALETGGHDWANVLMDGQHAVVSGAAPSFEASEAVLLELGEVNPFFTAITKVTSEISSAPPVSPFVFTAERLADGQLILAGHVPNQETLYALLTQAEAIAPGQVVNQVRIGTGEPLGPWKKTVVEALNQMGGLEIGRLELVDSDLKLSGVAKDGQMRARVLDALSILEAPYEAELAIDGPSHWSLRHQSGGLVASGQVASEAVRAEVLAFVSEFHDGPIRDDMRIGGVDYTAWLQPMRPIMPHFVKFSEGEISFAPAQGRYLVKGATTRSVQAYLEADLIEGGDYPVVLDLEAQRISLPELSGLDLSTPTLATCQAGFNAVMAANSVLFETGSANIDRASGATLDKIIAVATLCGDQSFEIRGHTDASGVREGNIALSKRRADAVKSFLEAAGLAGSRVETIGLGPDEPIASNENAAGRAANRRIEFKMREGG